LFCFLRSSLKPKTTASKREKFAKSGVRIVDTWLDAAVGLGRTGVLDAPKVRRIAVSSVQDWRQVISKTSASAWVGGTREDREAELRRSLAAASAHIAIDGLEPVSLEE
jgi:hypothetical protein